MPPIYDRPVRQIMTEWVRERLASPGSVLTRQDALAWFAEHYPKIRPGTVTAHLLKLATNEPTRVHYHVRPGEDEVLFKTAPGRYRLYDPSKDPPPITGRPKRPPPPGEPPRPPDDEEDDEVLGSNEFAYESDLRNYLAKNLSHLEPGLRLYEEEDITGIEFPVGGRRIDILAVGERNDYVVIELKVSRGYDRVVGQLLRYMAWIEQNHAESDQRVRGIIVAREITDDLRLACSRIDDIALFEYDLQVQVRKVSGGRART